LQAGHSLSDVLQISNAIDTAGFVVDYVEARQPNLQPIESLIGHCIVWRQN
jgi:pantoate--beta-alanine ligase